MVNDAFYVFEKEMEDATANEDSDEKTELHDNSEDDDYEEDDDNCDGKIPSPTNSASTLPSLKSNIDTAVRKIRKIVNKFRQSPVQNDVLQKAVKLKFDKELTLQRDCKTRWSSMVAMLERYLKLEDVVNSVLNEFNLSSLILSKDESDLIKDAVKCLSPFQPTTTFLCKQDQDLAAAERLYVLWSKS